MLNWFGVNVGHDPVYRAADIRKAGFNAVLLVMQRRSDVQLGAYIRECHDNGLWVVGRIANESMEWKDEGRRMSPDEAADFYAWTYCQGSSGDLDALSVLNEADGDPSIHKESWCLSPSEADVYLKAFLNCRYYKPDLPMYAVGTVTAQVSYVEALDQDILHQYTALDVHCYAQTPESVMDMLHNYDRIGMKYVIEEFGWPDPSAGNRGNYISQMMNVFEQNSHKILGAGLYCWSLDQHPQPFGVVRGKSNPTAAIPYIQALQYPGFSRFPPPEPAKGRFANGLGFEKWYRLEPKIIGEPIGWDETNVAPEWQTQATTNGILSWVGGKGHAFVTYPDKENRVHVYRWEEDWSSSQKIS